MDINIYAVFSLFVVAVVASVVISGVIVFSAIDSYQEGVRAMIAGTGEHVGAVDGKLNALNSSLANKDIALWNYHQELKMLKKQFDAGEDIGAKLDELGERINETSGGLEGSVSELSERFGDLNKFVYENADDWAEDTYGQGGGTTIIYQTGGAS